MADTARYPKAIFCSACYFSGKYSKVEECDEHGGIGAIETSQPAPKKGEVEVASLVEADMKKRVRQGAERYGTKLMTNNGRKPLYDAYEEAMDLVFYLRQEIFERYGE